MNHFKVRFLAHCRFNTKTLCLMAMLLGLTIASVYLPAIPIAPHLKVTYQSFCCILNGMLLGAVWGAAIQIIYIIMGICGLPIFTQGGGPMYVFQPSFGYLIGFVFGAFVSGLLMDIFSDCKRWKVILAAILGTLTIYPFGTSYQYLALTQFMGWSSGKALASLATTPFYILGDLLCLILIALMPMAYLRRKTQGPWRKKQNAPVTDDMTDEKLMTNDE